MNELNAAFWELRYAEGSTGWDAGSVTTPIKEFVDGLQDKQLSILIPGCGNAHEAAYLFQLGFHSVHILDYAKAPLQAFASACPDFPLDQLHCEDFFTHTGTYDLIIEQTFFCAIDPSLRTTYAKRMAKLLKPGGMLAGVLFIDPNMQGGPPFTGSTEEYRSLFTDAFHIRKLEPCLNSIPPRMNREAFIMLERKSNIL